MRIIILSIALLFCAFSAQSQVLKSAGVWYFLDVDSMTARPAVLPNGTEIAYVVGTKTVYYWNRATSTWTAYGSTFNRDSIYLDSSIVGSGTVSDPWGVDSTLFATIAGVGDSIAAAVANYFPRQGGTLTGTGGAGFIGLPSQVTAPGTPVSGLNIYAQGSSFNWKGTDGFERQFASTLTGGRTYTLPNVSGTFALGTGTTNRVPLWTTTNTLGNSNIQDNNTAVSILNSKPFQLGQWTTAGRPAGVNGYSGFNTTNNWPEWYSSSGWFSPARAATTGGAFTTTYVPFGGTGGLTQSSKITFDEPNSVLTLNSSYLLIQGPPTGITSGIRMTSSNTASLAYLSVTMQPSNGATTQFFSTNNAYPGYQVVTNNAFGLYHSGAGGMGIQVDNPAASVRFGVGTSGTVEKMRIDANGVGVFTTPTQEFDVNGDLRVRDSARLSILSSILQTEASGWVKALTIGGGLNYSGGTLRTNIDTASYIKGLGTIGTIPIFSGTRVISDSKMVYSSVPKQILYTGYDFFVRDSTVSGGVTVQLKNKAQGANATTGLVTYNQSDDYVVWGMSSSAYNTVPEVGANRGYIYTEAKRGFIMYSLVDTSSIKFKVGGGQGLEVRLDTIGVGIGTASPTAKLHVVGTTKIEGMLTAKQESYNTVTSTTSPVTLSNTISDNLINQGGTQATFTLKFPASPVDGQLLYITFNNAITTLTLDGNGNTIVGSAVTTGVAGSQRKFKFYSGIGWIKLY